MKTVTDVLIFVEDPGAANYIAQLPVTLTERGWDVELFADGYAEEYLLQREIIPNVLHGVTSARQILDRVKPRILIVGTSENPDSLGLKLIVESQKMHIQSVGAVDALPNSEYRFRGRSNKPLTYAPNWLIVPDKWTEKAYLDLGYPHGRVVVCGHPHYDHVHTYAVQLSKKDTKELKRKILPEVEAYQKVVVFATELSSGLNPHQFQRSSEYTLRGKGTSSGRTEIVLEEFLEAVRLIDPRPYLVLRLHPKNIQDEFSPYVDEFNSVSTGGSPLELLYIADLVVGMTSILLMEAALVKTPNLSIVPRESEMQWLPSIRMGITPCVTTRESLQFHLTSILRGNSLNTPSFDGEYLVYGALQKTSEFIETLLVACQ
jgi:hypothetical protein